MWKKLLTEQEIKEVIRCPRILINHVDSAIDKKAIDWSAIAKMETFVVKEIMLKLKTVVLCCRNLVVVKEDNKAIENKLATITKTFNELITESRWWYYDV